MTSETSADAASVVRRARGEDIPRILDLLTEYELPRSYFEPLYLGDPTYHPEQSWVIEQDGRLAAHLRLFNRWIRMHDTTLQIAGVGNVITSTAFRGRGHAGRLLDAMTAAATSEGFPYSLLWTHLPTLYERHGWVSIEQQTVRALLSERSSDPPIINSFKPEDLPEVIRIYETTNHDRAGPTMRTPDYWRSQLAWLENEPGDFLVARKPDGSLAGYVRSKITQSEVKVLELGVGAEQTDVGRALVARVARPRGNHVQARLPPSLLHMIPDSERDTEDDSRFMGRVLSLESLVGTLQPLLLRRLERAGLRAGACWLTTSAGTAELQLADGHVTLHPGSPVDPRVCLNEGELAHLLFHGFDQMAAELLDGRSDAALLRALFPAQDFVIWPADAF